MTIQAKNLLPNASKGVMKAKELLKKWEKVSVQDFVELTKKVFVPDFHLLTIYAASLVYTTLLGLVPLLALVFALLPTFGLLDQLEPVLLESLDPLGNKKHEVVRYIVKFVEELHLDTPVILVSLLATYLLLTLKIEKVFNALWHISNTRNLRQKVTNYIVAILVGPVLIFASLDLADTVMQWLSSVELFKIVLFYDIIPPARYLLILVAFVFLYTYMPNIKVKLSSAFVGSLFACVLWLIVKGIFLNLIVNSPRYGIYSGFAGAVLFIFWVYLGWLIILLGAKIAFYWQHRKQLSALMEPLSSREREEVALELVVRIARYNAPPKKKKLNFDDLVETQPRLLPDKLRELVGLLKQKKFIIESNGRFNLVRDTDAIKVKDILASVRGCDTIESSPSVDKLMNQIDKKRDSVVGGMTLADLSEDEDDDREGDG